MNKIPKLRFPEFSGEWEKVFLDNVTKRGTGHTPDKKKQEYYNGGIKWVSLGDSSRLDKGEIFETNTEISQKGIENSSAVIHPKGTVLLSRDAGVGKSAVMGCDMAVSQHFITWSMDGKMDNWFLYYYLQKEKKEFERIAVGSTIKTIGMPYFKSYQLYIPPINEQEEIASFLSSVDSKIEKLERKKELWEQYKKGMMQKIFSQELRFRDENGEDYPEWEEKSLGEVCEFSKGKGISKNDISDDGIECIRYGQLYTTYREKIEKVFSKTNLPVKDLVLSKENDIIIPSSGETAIDLATASCIIKSGIAIGGDINILRTEINGVFLSYYLNNKKKREIADMAQGISVMHLYSTQLKTLKITIPSLPEQTHIADFLSSIDSKIEIVGKELAGMKEFKKGLLQKMFV